MNQTAGSFVLAVLMLAAGAGCEWNDPDEQAVQHYVAGQLAMDRGDYQAALAELSKAVEEDPELSLAHTAIGDIRRKQGNYLGAVSAYESACRANPYAFRPHYNLGVTCQILSRAADSAESAARWIRRAVQTYIRAVTLRPKDFDANLNLSACYYQLSKYNLAERYCAEAIRIDPNSPFAHSNLGIIYDAQGRPYEAVRAYKDSLELDTHQPKLLLNLGATYARLGRPEDALQAFRLATKEDPRSPAPWEQMGACHYHQQQWDLAEQAYQKARELDERSPQAYRGLGVVHMTQYVLDGRQTKLRDQALTEWTRSLELDPNQPDLLRLVRKYTPAPAAPNL